MIPIRDTIHSERFPLINTMFIVLNVLVFWFQSSMGSQAMEQFVSAYGLVPAKFWSASGLAQWLPVFTSMFLHGG